MQPLPRQGPSANPSRLRGAHRGVEVWPDEGSSEGGWPYAWIVAWPGEGTVRNLAYVSLMKLFKLPSQD